MTEIAGVTFPPEISCRVRSISSMASGIAGTNPRRRWNRRMVCPLRPENAAYTQPVLNESATPDLDRLEGALYDCEAVLVEEPLFEKFNDEFTAYVSGRKAFDIARRRSGCTPDH